MKYKIEIPEYLTIGDYQKITQLEHLSDLEKTVEIVHIITQLDRDVVGKWKPNELAAIADKALELIEFENPTFYPIIEFDGVLYGYRPISKMTLAEYVDLERLSKEPNLNLDEIMAILYRPIVKNNTNSLKFQMKNGYKIAKGTAENLFKYYDIKEYSSEDRKIDAEKMSTFPVTLALGAMSFFLAIGTKSLNNTNHYLRPSEKMTITEEMDNLMESIGVGLAQFTHYQKVLSYQSPEIRVSSI